MNVMEALEALGPTAAHVAEKLKYLRCKGHRDIANLCPVARYLSKGGFENICVANCHCYVEGRPYWLPGAVSSFILNFDLGYYPELQEC